jgi:hypothetical protein
MLIVTGVEESPLTVRELKFKILELLKDNEADATKLHVELEIDVRNYFSEEYYVGVWLGMLQQCKIRVPDRDPKVDPRNEPLDVFLIEADEESEVEAEDFPPEVKVSDLLDELNNADAEGHGDELCHGFIHSSRGSVNAHITGAMLPPSEEGFKYLLLDAQR